MHRATGGLLLTVALAWGCHKDGHDAVALPEIHLDQGLIGHWKLDESGGNTAADSSVSGRAGTVSGSPTWLPSGGQVDGAIGLDGVDDYVAVAHDVSFNTYPLTVAAWVRTTIQNSDARGLVNKYVANSLNGWQVFCIFGTVYAFYFSSGINYIGPGSYGLNGGFIADDTWHHVAFIVEATGGKIYVDGTLADSANWTGTAAQATTTQELRLGNNPGNLLWFLPGMLDDVRIYSRALSVEEVQALAGMN